MESSASSKSSSGETRRRSGAIAGVVLVGVAVSIALFLFAQHREQERIRLAFLNRAGALQAVFSERLHRYTELLLTLRSFFMHSEEVTRAEFRSVVLDQVARTPGIQALEWVPRVSAAERAACEERARVEGLAGFEVKDRTEDGSFVRAAERTEYLPLLFVEPQPGNASVLGYDVALARTRGALAEARDTGEVRGSPPLVLAQETMGQLGWVLACAVPRGADVTKSDGDPRGYVQGVFRLPDMLGAVWTGRAETCVDILVVDETPDAAHRILHVHSSRPLAAGERSPTEAEVRRSLHEVVEVSAAGRRWALLMRPSPHWLAAQTSAMPYELGLGGLLMTALLTCFLRSLAGQTAAVQGLVTERTAELEESRRSLTMALEAARMGTWEHDLASGSVRWSPNLEPLFGLDPGGFGGTLDGYLACIHPADRERVRTGIADAVAQCRAHHFEFRIVWPDGTVRWMFTDGHVFCDEAGQPRKTRGVARDITDRMQAREKAARLEEQLRTSQKMEAIGLLAGGIAHDFNNLLHIIHGFAGLALMEEVSAPVRDSLEQITEAADRAAKLTGQLLVLGRSEPGRRANLDLSQVVQDLLQMLARVLGSHIAIDFQPGAQPCPVHGDKSQLEQVLLNLCLNARDAMAAGGRLRITLRELAADEALRGRHPQACTASQVQLTVADTGCGMDPATLARIYEPFFTTKAPGRGTGLGLAVVYSIVGQHGGTIDAESQPGEGTTFTIYLPAAEKSAAALSPVAPEETAAARGSETLLLVEDEAIVRTLAQRILEGAGYAVLTASDGAEGCEVFKAHADRIALVILDVLMPRMGGREAAEQLRSCAPVPILFCSGYTAGALPAVRESSAPTRFLTKPYTADALLAQVRELLDGVHAAAAGEA